MKSQHVPWALFGKFTFSSPLIYVDVLTFHQQILIILSRYRTGITGSLVQDYYYLTRQALSTILIKVWFMRSENPPHDLIDTNKEY